MGELVYIVARGEDALYSELIRSFADTPDIRVIHDRRVHQRRRAASAAPFG